MTFDSTGCFHWCSAREVEECTLTRWHHPMIIVTVNVIAIVVVVLIVLIIFIAQTRGNNDNVCRPRDRCNICRSRESAPWVEARKNLKQFGDDQWWWESHVFSLYQESDHAIEGVKHQLQRSPTHCSCRQSTILSKVAIGHSQNLAHDNFDFLLLREWTLLKNLPKVPQ